MKIRISFEHMRGVNRGQITSAPQQHGTLMRARFCQNEGKLPFALLTIDQFIA
jgi:hypothetical protein